MTSNHSEEDSCPLSSRQQNAGPMFAALSRIRISKIALLATCFGLIALFVANRYWKESAPWVAMAVAIQVILMRPVGYTTTRHNGCVDTKGKKGDIVP
jgi:hypothetical protein